MSRSEDVERCDGDNESLVEKIGVLGKGVCDGGGIRCGGELEILVFGVVLKASAVERAGVVI